MYATPFTAAFTTIDGLSPELRRYARSEGIEPSSLRPSRRPRRRAAGAVRDAVAGLRRPGRFVPAGQH